MPRNFKLFLEDALEAITKIQKYSNAMEFDDFCKDEKTVDAVLRNAEIAQ